MYIYTYNTFTNMYHSLTPIRHVHPKHKSPIDCGFGSLSGKRKDYKIDFDFAYPRSTHH